MSGLRERVIVHTPTGDLDGELFVGHDGLPELRVMVPCGLHPPGVDARCYRPATLPAVWSIRAVHNGGGGGVLFDVFDMIDRCRRDITRAVCAQPGSGVEREHETRREPDDIDAYKRDAEARRER